MVSKRIKSKSFKLGKEKKETKVMRDLKGYINLMKLLGRI